MATFSPQPAPANPPAIAVSAPDPAPAPAPADDNDGKALFKLLKPITTGSESEDQLIWMRAIHAADLAILDAFKGQPIALAQHMVAALCDLTIEQVQLLSIEDFTVLAGEVIFLVKQVIKDLGMSPPAFLESDPADEE